MMEIPAKNTFWLSVSLNIFLGSFLFYYTLRYMNSASSIPKFPFPGQSPASACQNATENFSHFPIDLGNATAVFNSVYGVTKEKDSNINPVGVSFYPAYLPPNTMMYHSREDPNIPESFEWIAMDYEFSYSFASFTRGKSRGGHGPHAPGKKPGNPEEPDNPEKPGNPGGPKAPKGPGTLPGGSRKDLKKSSEGQMSDPAKKDLDKRGPFGNDRSYLLTFKNKLPLDKLIFLDGASAAKSATGEMDQQLILSQQEDLEGPVFERAAADRICKWGKPFGLQGVVRLEVGFEIILCDFQRDVELVSNVALYNVTELAGLPYEQPIPATNLEKERSSLIDHWQSMSGFEWMQAGGNVNDGDDRILIDFSNLVTPLNKTWIDPDPYQRRIHKIPQELKNEIVTDLEGVLSRGVDPFRQTNWRQVIDTIVKKFSPMLIGLNGTLAVFESSAESDLGSALKEASESLSSLTYNFVRRYTDEDTVGINEQRSQALTRAVEDYVHNTFQIRTKSDRLIYSSVYRVTQEVISMVFDLYDVSIGMIPDFYVKPSGLSYSTYSDVLLERGSSLRTLLKSLGWSSFTKCSSVCQWDEVCAVPGWGPGPMGWSFGNQKSLHYEDGSYRVNQKLQCISVKQMGR